jgi:hypothetical protein
VKKLIITISFIIIAGNVFSQWFAELSTGYAMSTMNGARIHNNIETTYDYIENQTRIENYPTRFTIIQSPFVQITGGYNFNKIALKLDLAYHDNITINNVNTSNVYYRKDITIWNNEEEYYFKNIVLRNYFFYIQKSSLTPAISYSFKFSNHFVLKPEIGLTFKWLKIYEKYVRESETFKIDSGETNSVGYVSSTYNYHYPFAPDLNNLLSFNSGISVTYIINNKFSIWSKANYNLGKMYEVTKKIQTYFKEENEDGDVLESSNSVDTYSSSLRFNVNTVNISLGLRYTFGSTKNQGNDG